ncbi:MAG: sulfotransferase, partial [Deltaproteobacteria bacterium]|nr:sulfotransferase [Deltaproteobacteria bacterium]
MTSGLNMRSTSVNYIKPYRPMLLRFLNSSAPHVYNFSLDFDNLLKASQKAEGINFAGELQFEEPLKVLLKSIEKEAELNWFGKFITRQRLINLLRNRLRIEKLVLEHPEILDIELLPPLLITGLQRTGTTMLHRLLDGDPLNRALISYEALNPGPLHDDPGVDLKKKLKLAKTAQKALNYIAPDFFAVHPVEADSPEEDVLLLDYAFLSTVAESTMNVPSYAAYVEKCDNAPAYRYMHLLLKVLSWQQSNGGNVSNKRWVLKSPHHLEFLDTFLNEFKDAAVIMPHRDPNATLPSFCSMIAHGHGIFSDHVNPSNIGAHWLRKTSRMLEKGLETRNRRTDTTFI